MSIGQIVRLSEYRKISDKVDPRLKAFGKKAVDAASRTAIDVGRVVALPVALVALVLYGSSIGASSYLRRLTDIGWALIESEMEELNSSDSSSES